MSIYITITLFAFLFVLSYITSKQNIFAPAVITSGVWLLVLLLTVLIPNDVNSLTTKFLSAINYWVILFCLSSLFIQSFKVKKTFVKPSPLAKQIMFYLSLITFPLFLFNIYKVIQISGFSNLMFNLRLATIGGIDGVNIENMNPFYAVIWIISYLIELINYDKKNKKRIIVLFLMYSIFAFLTMAKIHFLILFISTIFILYLKKKVKMIHIIIGTLVLIFVFFQIQSLRSKDHDVNMQASDFISLYLISPPAAFETVKPQSFDNKGENVFRIYYAIKNKFGFSDVKPINTLIDFVDVGVGTNTYTVMYPYYKDFGTKGIVIFAIIMGTFFGYVFKKTETNDYFAIVYSVFLYEIIMQYGADMFFTNLSLNLQRLLIALLPYLITKYELFSIKKKEQKINE